MKSKSTQQYRLWSLALLLMLMCLPQMMWAQDWTIVGVKYGTCGVSDNSVISFQNLNNSSWGGNTIQTSDNLSSPACKGTIFVGCVIDGKEVNVWPHNNHKYMAITQYSHSETVPAYAKLNRTSTFKMVMATNRYFHGAGLYVFNNLNDATITNLDAMPGQNEASQVNCSNRILNATDNNGEHTWTEKSYTITYDNSTSATEASVTRYIVLMHVNTTGDNYSTKIADNGDQEWAGFMEASEHTDTYTYYANITFDANGGTGSMSNQTIENSATLTANTFTREGYSFTGWNTKADGTGTAYADAADFAATNTNKGPVTLYAQWKESTITISFDANGGSGTMAQQVINNSATLNANAFTYEGYTFTGWNTKADGTGTAYAADATLTVTEENRGTTITLYAQWDEEPVPVYKEDGITVDYYEIQNVNQFISFAKKVNGGQTGINAKLTQDINLSTSQNLMLNEYRGTLDGNGYQLTVNINRTVNDAAFIQKLYGTVKKLTIAGTIKTSKKFAASIAAHAYGCTISQCTSLVNIESSASGDGTHGGFIAVAESGSGSTIENCHFAGSMKGSSTNSCGGFIGWSSASGTQINNSLLTATFTVSTNSSNTFSRNPGNVTVSNCFYKNALGDVPSGATKVTDTQLGSGEIAYDLNNQNTDGTQAWYQKIGSDTCPVLKSTGSNTVFCGYEPGKCVGSYINTPNSDTPVHDWEENPTWTWSADGKTATATFTCKTKDTHKATPEVIMTNTVKTEATCFGKGSMTYTATTNFNGTTFTAEKDVEIPAGNHSYLADYDEYGVRICSVCQKTDYQPLGNMVNNYYEIHNAGQLVSFAQKVNSGQTGINGKLINDIDMSTVCHAASEGVAQANWTPMALNTNNGYSGTFDGDGHTISHLYYNDSGTSYVGFISRAYCATIKSVGLLDVYFNGYDVVGGVCGSTRYSTITNCYVTGDVSGSTTTVGGVCGSNSKESKITNCYTIANTSGQYFGGICGTEGYNSYVINCYSSYYPPIFNDLEENWPSYAIGSIKLERFKSGEITWFLNGTCTEEWEEFYDPSHGTTINRLYFLWKEGPIDGTQAWYQAIGTDDYPILKKDGDVNTVYYDYIDSTHKGYINKVNLITFDANGGSGTMAPQVISGSSVVINANTFTRNGYAFTGWNTAADGTGTAYAAGATYTETDSNKGSFTLYAQWERALTTITFDANGGEGTMTTQDVDYSGKLTANTFTREGYQFVGWRTAADSGTYYIDKSTFNVTMEYLGTTTLYAWWAPVNNTVWRYTATSKVTPYSGTELKNANGTTLTFTNGFNDRTNNGVYVFDGTLTNIGNRAFYNCTGFTGSLTIPNSVTSIGSHAFNGCTGFTGRLTIGNNVKSIGQMAFYGCTGFVAGSLTIPSSVTTIGNMAFWKSFMHYTMKSIPNVGYDVFESNEYESIISLSLSDDSYVAADKGNFPSPDFNPTFTREMSNEWETLVVPFSITYNQSNGSYRLYHLAGTSASDIAFAEYENGAKIDAGTPMVIKAVGTKNNSDKYEVTIKADGTDVSTSITTSAAIGGLELTGSYATKNVDANAGYVLTTDKFVKTTAATAVSPFRAYLSGSVNGVSFVYLPGAIIPGELNGDGNITIADLTRLVEILNGRATNTNGAADVDGNGTVNTNDAEALKQKLFASPSAEE